MLIGTNLFDSALRPFTMPLFRVVLYHSTITATGRVASAPSTSSSPRGVLNPSFTKSTIRPIGSENDIRKVSPCPVISNPYKSWLRFCAPAGLLELYRASRRERYQRDLQQRGEAPRLPGASLEELFPG